ncbi:MAG: hypothetical protein R3B82_17495 [Sandaracinaceae bacterium]
MGPEWLVIGTVLAVLLGGVGAAAVGAARRASPYQDAMEERWNAAAMAIGGRLEVVSRKTLAPRVLRLVVELDDAIAIASLAVPVSADAETHTTVRARYVLGVGPRFVAQPRRVHERGHAWMPRSLVASAGETRGVFTREVNAICEGIPRPLTIRSDGHEIEVIWDGAENDANVIDDVLRLAGALAQHGADHLRGLATLDDATYEGKSDEGPRVRVRRGLVDVRLLVRAIESGPEYLARVDARQGTPSVEIAIGAGGGPSTAIPDGLIAPGAEAELARLAPATLAASSTHVELRWSEPPTLDQARAAVHLLAAIGASPGSQGAFR